MFKGMLNMDNYFSSLIIFDDSAYMNKALYNIIK